jgi:hypothetical protein
MRAADPRIRGSTDPILCGTGHPVHWVHSQWGCRSSCDRRAAVVARRHASLDQSSKGVGAPES